MVLEVGHAIGKEEEWVREDGVQTNLTVKFPIWSPSSKAVAIGAIGADITERKQAEQTLRECEQQISSAPTRCMAVITAGFGLLWRGGVVEMMRLTPATLALTRSCERRPPSDTCRPFRTTPATKERIGTNGWGTSTMIPLREPQRIKSKPPVPFFNQLHSPKFSKYLSITVET